ncbi:MAG: FHA domain-containing protein [Hyphomicrobiaceae bacterium]
MAIAPVIVLALTLAVAAETTTLLAPAPSPEHDLIAFARRGLDRHPSLMLAGLAALTVPFVALAAALSRLACRIRRRAVVPPLRSEAVPMPDRAAWIEIPGRPSPPLAIGELVRIGHSDDCDLLLADATLGGTCALIQRTTEHEFILFDVSAGEARLAVNGAPSARCRLSDGDRIEIGSACVVFRKGHASPERTRPISA